jgi:hypothetical protein
MKIKELIAPNDLDKKSKPIGKLPCWNDKKYLNIGAAKGVSAVTVSIKDTKTGQIYGRRSFYQKS